MHNLTIRELQATDGAALSTMLLSNSPAYQAYFIPFSFEEAAITAMLTRAVKDRYWGMWVGSDLAAFFMLRGFDEGYAMPSYGVAVAEPHSGKGLLKLSLQFALTWCKVNGVARMMLKVHPDNIIARRIYERFGFQYDGEDPMNHNRIYSRAL
jgi:RimJ/RimL family protein N-acetyltransferase